MDAKTAPQGVTIAREFTIEDELEKLGLTFHVKTESRKRMVAPDAYHAGREAGRKFEPRRGVEAA